MKNILTTEPWSCGSQLFVAINHLHCTWFLKEALWPSYMSSTRTHASIYEKGHFYLFFKLFLPFAFSSQVLFLHMCVSLKWFRVWFQNSRQFKKTFIAGHIWHSFPSCGNIVLSCTFEITAAFMSLSCLYSRHVPVCVLAVRLKPQSWCYVYVSRLTSRPFHALGDHSSHNQTKMYVVSWRGFKVNLFLTNASGRHCIHSLYIFLEKICEKLMIYDKESE